MAGSSRLAGVVLAGGESRRFGGDKAAAILAGRTLLDHVCTSIASACQPVYVVAPAGRALPDVAVPFVRLDDVFPGEGPLGGLLTAFREIRAGEAFVTACDMPLLSTTLIEQLAMRRGEALASVAVTGSKLQPLCSVYGVSEALEQAETLFAAGERSLRVLLRSGPIALLRLDEIESIAVTAVNTREDLESLELLMGPPDGTG